MARGTIYQMPRRAEAGRGHRHQHLRPQLRRPLRGQRPCGRRPDRPGSRPTRARWTARAAAAARLRPRRRPDRARLSSRPAEISAAPRRAARRRPVRAHLLGRGAGRRSRASCCASATRYGNAAILDASRSGSLSMLHGRVAAQALPPHVRRLHRAVVEHVGGGRGLRGAHDLRRQGRLQERRPRADRLRELAS